MRHRQFIERRIKTLDDKIEQLLKDNMFMEAQQAELCLQDLESKLLNTYSNTELHNLYNEGLPNDSE